MATRADSLHFVLFPFMAQGHMIPMIDIAKLLAPQGVIITIFTTPHNAARFQTILGSAIESGLPLNVVEFAIPCEQAGLPEGCENRDLLPSLDLCLSFFTAANMLKEPVQKLFAELKPRPSCVISDKCLPYTIDIADKFQVPRIVFHGVCCFCLVCLHHLRFSKVLQDINSESKYFVAPNLPDRVEFTKSQLPMVWYENIKKISEQMEEADRASYGVIMNTFEELEPAYVKEYKKARGEKAVNPRYHANSS